MTATTTAPNFDGRFKVAGMPGVAFYLTGYATEWTGETWDLICGDTDDEHEHDGGCYAYGEPEEIDRTDMVRAVMVGDDRVHLVDVDDLTEISDDSYCPGCGQIGCGHYV